MKFARREKLLLGLLLLTAIAGLWPLPDSEVAETNRDAPTRSRNTPSGAQPARAFGALTPSAPGEQTAIADLFPRQSWTPPPVAVPEKPVAPPLPFSYGGRYTEGSKVFVFLNEGTLVHTARQGDTVKESYRVDEIGDQAITLTYLPLGLKQTLPAGGISPAK